MLTWLGPEYLFRKHFPNKLDNIIVGYTGGKTGKPTYQQVCNGTTGHAESVQITYDPEVVSYESLVDFFFRMHGTYPSQSSNVTNIVDPTTLNYQGIPSRINR
jgi:methionine-S-sulfoxide reductase